MTTAAIPNDSRQPRCIRSVFVTLSCISWFVWVTSRSSDSMRVASDALGCVGDWATGFGPTAGSDAADGSGSGLCGGVGCSDVGAMLGSPAAVP